MLPCTLLHQRHSPFVSCKHSAGSTETGFAAYSNSIKIRHAAPSWHRPAAIPAALAAPPHQANSLVTDLNIGNGAEEHQASPSVFSDPGDLDKGSVQGMSAHPFLPPSAIAPNAPNAPKATFSSLSVQRPSSVNAGSSSSSSSSYSGPNGPSSPLRPALLSAPTLMRLLSSADSVTALALSVQQQRQQLSPAPLSAALMQLAVLVQRETSSRQQTTMAASNSGSADQLGQSMLPLNNLADAANSSAEERMLSPAGDLASTSSNSSSTRDASKRTKTSSSPSALDSPALDSTPVSALSSVQSTQGAVCLAGSVSSQISVSVSYNLATSPVALAGHDAVHLYSQLSELCLAELDLFDGPALCACISAIACLRGPRCGSLAAEMLAALMYKLRDCPPRHLCNALLSAAHMGASPSHEWRKMLYLALLPGLPAWQPAELASAIWALGALRCDVSGSVVGALLQQSQGGLQQLTLGQLTAMLQGLASLSVVPSHEWCMQLNATLAGVLPQCAASELVRLLQALAQLQVRVETSVCSALAEALKRYLPTLSAEQCAVVLVSCGQLAAVSSDTTGQPPAALSSLSLSAVVSEVLTAGLPSWSPQQAASVLAACGRMHLPLPSLLLQHMMDGLAQAAPQLRFEDVASALSGYSKLCMFTSSYDSSSSNTSSNGCGSRSPAGLTIELHAQLMQALLQHLQRLQSQSSYSWSDADAVCQSVSALRQLQLQPCNEWLFALQQGTMSMLKNHFTDVQLAALFDTMVYWQQQQQQQQGSSSNAQHSAQASSPSLKVVGAGLHPSSSSDNSNGGSSRSSSSSTSAGGSLQARPWPVQGAWASEDASVAGRWMARVMWRATELMSRTAQRTHACMRPTALITLLTSMATIGFKPNPVLSSLILDTAVAVRGQCMPVEFGELLHALAALRVVVDRESTGKLLLATYGVWDAFQPHHWHMLLTGLRAVKASPPRRWLLPYQRTSLTHLPSSSMQQLAQELSALTPLTAGSSLSTAWSTAFFRTSIRRLQASASASISIPQGTAAIQQGTILTRQGISAQQEAGMSLKLEGAALSSMQQQLQELGRAVAGSGLVPTAAWLQAYVAAVRSHVTADLHVYEAQSLKETLQSLLDRAASGGSVTASSGGGGSGQGKGVYSPGVGAKAVVGKATRIGKAKGKLVQKKPKAKKQ